MRRLVIPVLLGLVTPFPLLVLLASMAIAFISTGLDMISPHLGLGLQVALWIPVFCASLVLTLATLPAVLAQLLLMSFYLVHPLMDGALSAGERTIWALLAIFVGPPAWLAYWLLRLLWPALRGRAEAPAQGLA